MTAAPAVRTLTGHMIGRLIVGALVGVLLGIGLAAALIKGLGIVAFGAVFAYVFATLAGLLTGLFAGKPIWAAGGQIEAGLKAFFGAALAAAGMFAIRQWVHVNVDLSSFGAGAGQLGELPAAALPLIAGVLGAFFGADNTPEGNDKSDKGTGVRVADPGASKKSAATALEEDDQELAPPKRARR